MSDVVTTWGAVLEVDAPGGVVEDVAGHWFAEARAAYFERCPVLAALLAVQDARLLVIDERIDPVAMRLLSGVTRIGVSVVEVRPSSFETAVRIRSGADGGRTANGRCTVVIERRPTGERIPIPPQVRDEFVAIQLAARDLC